MSSSTSNFVVRVVVVPSSWLDYVQTADLYVVGDSVQYTNFVDDDWANDEDEKQEEHGEVEDSVADDTSFPKLRLLQGVDWWSNLAAGNY